MIDKCYFYSNKNITRKSIQLLENRNTVEIQETNERLFLKKISNDHENELFTETRFYGIEKQNQNWSPRGWWQNQLTDYIRDRKQYSDWYRLYLPDPDERDWNEEWVPPDEYYQNQPTHPFLQLAGLSKVRTSTNELGADYLRSTFNSASQVSPKLLKVRGKTRTDFEGHIFSGRPLSFWRDLKREGILESRNVEPSSERCLGGLKNFISWNDFGKFDRDLIYLNLLLFCFNQTLLFLETQRELLDDFADYITRYETLRKDQIEKNLKLFIT